jgi:hypothetical protein
MFNNLTIYEQRQQMDMKLMMKLGKEEMLGMLLIIYNRGLEPPFSFQRVTKRRDKTVAVQVLVCV